MAPEAHNATVRATKIKTALMENESPLVMINLALTVAREMVGIRQDAHESDYWEPAQDGEYGEKYLDTRYFT